MVKLPPIECAPYYLFLWPPALSCTAWFVRRSSKPCGLRVICLYLCVGLQLLMSACPASGMVLCRAEDGHVAIETGHCGSPCLDDYRRHHPVDPAPRDFERHRCTDTVLASPAVSAASVRTVVSSDARSSAFTLLSPAVLFDPYGTSPLARVLRDLLFSCEQSLRTIVLLI